jgi:S-adenosylmethionine:tRNA ribosyltransferase-isomerase
MVLDRASGETRIEEFARLGELLPAGALLVANNSRVVPARLFGAKPSGGRVEFLLLTPLPLIRPVIRPDGWSAAEVEGLLRASKAPKAGEAVDFGPDLSLEVMTRAEFGRARVRLRWRGELGPLLDRLGHLPLPPYIRREDCAADRERYQTVYADAAKAGSVAAPTAGLHFTPGQLDGLRAAGFGWAEVTLYVGYGTFSPVRTRDIRDHMMHREYVELSVPAAAAVRQAKAEGRPVVAVGTTSVRVLESAWAETGLAAGRLEAWSGWTGLFISPGYRFGVVDQMVTNFHLPGSSLIIMVSALAGRARVLSAYGRAVAAGLRFFSYGDAMLVR